MRVNIDYESVLFWARPGPRWMNESLEFLAFFLETVPLFTTKAYAPAYLRHVESLVAREPQTVSEGPFQNWWGPLVNPERERWLNSKVTSTELIQSRGWCTATAMVPPGGTLLSSSGEVLLKDPFGMSGRGFQVLAPGDAAPNSRHPLVAEPLLKRTHDFSSYVLSTGETIHYQNHVDDRFQYKGTTFTDLSRPTLSALSFHGLVAPGLWGEFSEALRLIGTHYATPRLGPGFSVDSFVHATPQGLRIRHLAEVNYRRTMGLTAFQLAAVLGKGKNWARLLLGKSLGDFPQTASRVSSLAGAFLLSPGDTKFEVVLLTAQDSEEGEAKTRELKKSLPGCEFAV